MKNFLQFLTEAGASQASAQASKLNLTSDGHGSWLDSRGKLVATTDQGKLKFLNKKVKADDIKPKQTVKKPEGPVKQMSTARADDKLAGAKAKEPDLNANDIDAAVKIIAGTARSMGVETDL